MYRCRTVSSVLVALAIVAAGCGNTSRPPAPVAGGGGDASCAHIAIFDGHEYHGGNAVVHPVPGEVIGEARLPGCKDPNESTTPPDEFVQVARLADVDPSVAFVDAATPQVVYVRSDLDPLPAAVARLFDAPSCRQEDTPIELKGQWLGIIEPGSTTELDMHPPYRVSMLVTHPSPPRYVNTEIDIYVPPSLGSPLTHEDVKTSLWQGGMLLVRSTCDGTRFVAESIEAFPP